MIVPIQCENNNDDPPEYGMIELNGELVPPTETPTNDENSDNFVENDRVELGSLRFTKEVSRNICVMSMLLLPMTRTLTFFTFVPLRAIQS